MRTGRVLPAAAGRTVGQGTVGRVSGGGKTAWAAIRARTGRLGT
jgi:hypothetical protein